MEFGAKIQICEISSKFNFLDKNLTFDAVWSYQVTTVALKDRTNKVSHF